MNAQLSDRDMTAIQDVLIEQLGVTRPQITPEARIVEDLGADSLDVTEIVLLLEERFNCTIPDERLDGVQTAGDIYELMAWRLEQTA